MKAAVRSWLRLLLVVFLTNGACNRGFAGDYPLWGKLPKGAYAVGFRSLWQFDYSRTYNMSFTDKTSYASGKAPRPILINVWYPADPASLAKPMRHCEYLQIASDEPSLAKFSSELAKYEHSVIAKEVMHKDTQKLADAEKQLLDEFLNTPTASRREAAPAPGKFPLVIYHAGFGSSFEDNSVQCEFLASHGFVVMGSAFQEPTGKSFNIDGGPASGRDMDFLIAYARQLPYVNWKHIAVVGHSGGAHAALQYRAQPNSVLDAVVSLDTTQDYYSLADPRWNRMTEAVAKHPENFTGPLLIVANPHAFFQMCDMLKGTRRYYLTLKELEHNDFISQGVVHNELLLKLGADATSADKAGKSGSSEAERKAHTVAVRKSYEALCGYVLRYLEATLKSDKQAQDYLANQYRETKLGGPAPHVEYALEGTTGPTAYREGDAALPTPRQLRPFLREHGVEKTIALLRRVRKEEPGNLLFHHIFEFALVYELLEQGKNQDAIAFYQFYREANPDFVSLFLLFGDAFGRFGKNGFGLSCYKKALILDPGNAKAAQKLNDAQKSK